VETAYRQDDRNQNTETHFTISTKRKKRYRTSKEEMELNKEKKMKSEQAVLPNPCLEEEEEESNGRWIERGMLLGVCLYRGGHHVAQVLCVSHQ
jgi:hypothetical protein